MLMLDYVNDRYMAALTPEAKFVRVQAELEHQMKWCESLGLVGDKDLPSPIPYIQHIGICPPDTVDYVFDLMINQSEKDTTVSLRCFAYDTMVGMSCLLDPLLQKNPVIEQRLQQLMDASKVLGYFRRTNLKENTITSYHFRMNEPWALP